MLQELETKLEKAKSKLLELSYKKKTAEERVAELKSQVGDTTLAMLQQQESQFLAEKSSLEQKVQNLCSEVDKIQI